MRKNKRLKILLIVLALAISAYLTVLIYVATGDIGRIYSLDKVSNIDIQGQNSFYMVGVLAKGIALKKIFDRDFVDIDFQSSHSERPVKYQYNTKTKDGIFYHILTYNGTQYAVEYKHFENKKFFKGIYRYLDSTKFLRLYCL